MRLAAGLAAILTALAIAGCGSGQHAAPARPPVVVLIFDEFPVDALLRPDGSIDAERYPHFADLAAHSTWFPNAFTVYDSTFKSVPAIMDAVKPRPATVADYHSHPRSIYTLMHRLGYGVDSVASAEALCPPRICPGGPTRRPGVLARLAGGGRPARLNAWIGAIRARTHPTFYLQHALLPHEPWIYLPSGHQSRPSGNDPVPNINRPGGFGDRALTNHNETRHLLQVGFVDHEVGLVLARLRRTGLLDKALLVVTADHGYAFEVGVKDRRLVTARNVDEIAPIPMFIKAPGQTHGSVDRSFVRSIDVTPTIADLLGARVDWPHQGRSAFAASTRRRTGVALPTRDFSRVIRIGGTALARRRAENRRRRARLVLTGAESQLLFGSPWASLYRVGSHPGLIGRRVRSLPHARRGTARAIVANAELFRHVNPADELVPTRVTGTIAGGSGGLRDVAVAINGRIRATGRSFRLDGAPEERFSMLVPEESLQPGANSVGLYAIGRGGRLTPL
ncbi:MAG TPA: sulfatase-like hydrolase/transferase [Thermoleophilaceae bacterium]